MTELLKLKYVYVILFCFIVLTLASSEKIHADQQIRILADEMMTDDRNERIEAQGDAIAIDSTGLKLQSDKLIYNNIEETIITKGNVIFNDLDGNTYFFYDVTSDKEMQNLSGKNPKARLEDGSRAVGSNLIKKNNITKINNAEYTPCDKNDYLIKNCPGWKLKSKNIYQDSDTKTIHYDHARIHLFNIPVLYLPYFSHPDPSVKKRSGFLMPTVESDQNLGNSFQIPI